MRWFGVPHTLLASSALLLGGFGGFLSANLGRAVPQTRSITITAHKYAYDPPVLRVNQGDRLRIRLVAKDVTHGFYLEGYDLDGKARPENPTFWVRQPSKGTGYKEVEEISFVASHTGKFRYRCSLTCGYMHPFMQGELIVGPNYLFSTSVGLSLGMAVGVLVLFRGLDSGAHT